MNKPEKNLFAFLSILILISLSSCDLLSKILYEFDSSSSYSSSSSSPSFQGIMGEWLFSGNAQDNSGNNNNGTVTGAVLTNDRANIPDSAYWFNGINNVITVPHSASLNMTASMSVSVWIKPEGASQISGAAILAKGCYPLESYVMDIPTSNLRFYFKADSGSTYPKWKSAWYASSVIDRWIHLVYVFDSTAGVVKIYQDGVLITGLQGDYFPGYMDTNTHELSIGSRKSSSVSGYNYSFKGGIDDVRIFNRVLNDPEIQYLAQE